MNYLSDEEDQSNEFNANNFWKISQDIDAEKLIKELN